MSNMFSDVVYRCDACDRIQYDDDSDCDRCFGAVTLIGFVSGFK